MIRRKTTVAFLEACSILMDDGGDLTESIEAFERELGITKDRRDEIYNDVVRVFCKHELKTNQAVVLFIDFARSNFVYQVRNATPPKGVIDLLNEMKQTLDEHRKVH